MYITSNIYLKDFVFNYICVKVASIEMNTTKTLKIKSKIGLFTVNFKTYIIFIRIGYKTIVSKNKYMSTFPMILVLKNI